MSNERQYCTFYLDQHYFGIDVLRVQEIIRYQAITRVPLAPSVVQGMINLRGQIVTAIDLRRRLGFKERDAGQEPVNIVVRTEDGAISLLVDEIGDVLDVPDSAFEPPPDTLQGAARSLIPGAYKLKDHLMLQLNIDEAVNVTNRTELVSPNR